MGNPEVYAEPFSGSLAVLLARPGGAGKKEVVGDTNGLICNFWRAIQSDPEAVAYHADYPTIHQDLTARHKHLVAWGRENAERLSDDPRWFDVEFAGWWVWGISNWISPSKWCTEVGNSNSVPQTQHPPGSGQGVQISRKTLPVVSSSRPCIKSEIGGTGVQAQRLLLPPYKKRGQRLIPWFNELARRLACVIVLNRGWEFCVTRSVLSDYSSTKGARSIGVFLDPPYLTGNRTKGLYASDLDETSDAAARDSWAWAVEHGDRYRIAYACHEGDFDAPVGWTVSTAPFAGVGNPERRAAQRDCVMFSPACVPPARLL